MQTITVKSESAEQTKQIGQTIGSKLSGGELFEFKSDLGGGKTTFVSGLAKGFGSPDPVASPSFTISYVYTRSDGKQLHHFDFYRLDDPGVVAQELAEVEGDQDVVVAVEWGEIVHSVLPQERVLVTIEAGEGEERSISFKFTPNFAYLFTQLEQS